MSQPEEPFVEGLFLNGKAISEDKLDEEVKLLGPGWVGMRVNHRNFNTIGVLVAAYLNKAGAAAKDAKVSVVHITTNSWVAYVFWYKP